MKRYNISEIRNTLVESKFSRANILTMFEAVDIKPAPIMGRWGGYTITLPDGIQLKTKNGIRCKSCPVEVYNENGQYTAFSDGHPIELVYVLNESRVTEVRIFE